MAYYYNSGTEFVKIGEPIYFTATTDRYNESPYTAEDCSATIKAYTYPTGRMSCIDAAAYIVQKAIYEALCSQYKPETEYITFKDWYKTTPTTKEDLIRYIKNDVNSVYGMAKEIQDKIGDIIEGDDKVENFIKDIEIKKKVSKKGSCMQYKFMLYRGYPFLTVENYDEDCNLSADFILSLTHICFKCSVNKLIFRDHKVIAISKDERFCGEDEKTGKSIWKKKSYVADCMDADDYNPYIGATIAINKCVADSYYKKDSKSHLRRLREKIDRASEDA